MISKLVTYEVRKESVPKALEAIRTFVDQVKRKEGGTARYEAYQSADGVHFTHLMTFRVASAEGYHQKTAWCKAFVETLYPLCVAPPVFTDVSAVE